MATVSEARGSAQHLAQRAVATIPGAGRVTPLLHDAPDLARMIIDVWQTGHRRFD